MKRCTTVFVGLIYICLLSLLDHKADVNHADVDNLRPILIACRAGHVDILNLLLQCKADINVSDNDGVTPLSTAIFIRFINIRTMLQ
jgi:ankyrin repeat protein